MKLGLSKPGASLATRSAVEKSYACRDSAFEFNLGQLHYISIGVLSLGMINNQYYSWWAITRRRSPSQTKARRTDQAHRAWNAVTPLCHVTDASTSRVYVT